MKHDASAGAMRVEAVGAVVVGPGERVLAVKRGRPPSKGTWTLPGGKVEAGETYAEATVRELREETGLEVRVLEEVAVVAIDGDGFAYDIHEQLCVPASREDELPRVAAADDAAEARWVTVGELAGLGASAKVLGVVTLALARLAR